MSRLFKSNVVLLIVFYYLSVSFFSNSFIYATRNLMPIVILISGTLNFSYKIEVQSILDNVKFKKIKCKFLIFIILSLIGIITINKGSQSLLELFGLIVLFILSFYIVPQYLDTKKKYIDFIKTFQITLTILLVIGVLIGILYSNETFTNYSGRLRYQSILNNTNTLGSYAMLLTVMSAMVLYIEKERKQLYIIIPSFLLLLSTNSRTSILTSLVFIGLTTFFYVNSRIRFIQKISEKNKYIFPILAVIIGTGTIFLFKNLSLERLNVILSGRLYIWKEAFINMDKNNLLLGLPTLVDTENPHNYFILSILNWGLINAIVFLSITLEIMVNLFNKIKESNKVLNEDKYYYINFSLLISFIIYSFFESVFFNIGNLQSVFLWFNMGWVIHYDDEKY